MKFNIGESYEGFRLIEETPIAEIDGIGRVFCHEKSGVTVFSLSNLDSHKVFSMGFQTLPENNKGTAHIVEHSVCCASVHYPLKETFMALQQGSICTTMNACTYPDMTVYYAASPHEKDLLGLAKVYIDLVFHPLINQTDDYFKQEGWHYVLEDEKSPLTYSGVVYHEMEGEYAEAMTHLEAAKQKILFSHTPYQYDAGGEPEAIVTLGEKEFLDFYEKHYQGTNCYITFYGDGDVLEQLRFLNQNGLENITKGIYEPPKLWEESFSMPKRETVYYPTEQEEAQTILSLSFVVGDNLDYELRLGFELLEHMLIRSSASPLLRTLVMEGGIGVSLSDGGYDSCRRQPTFTITLKGCESKDSERFEQLIFKTLEELVQEGIPQDLIEASLSTLAFELKEVDASYEPIGVQYSEMILNSYLHGGSAFEGLAYEKHLEAIKQGVAKGYFEAIIKRYLLNNPHRTLITLIPSDELAIKSVKRKKENLKQLKKSMNKAQLQALIADNKALEEMQLLENTPEALSLLPHLTKQDMPKQLEALVFEKNQLAGCEVLYQEEATKGIAYIHFLWQAQGVKQEDLPYVGLLAHLFSYVGTKDKNYEEIENAINTHTGGLHSAIHAYYQNGKGDYKPIFKVSCKVLCSKLSTFTALMKELFTKTKFVEQAKIKEIMGHMLYEMERSFTGAPEYRATSRLYTYFTSTGIYEDQVAGLSFYQKMKPLYDDFEAQFEHLTKKLEEVYKVIMNQTQLRLCVTTSKYCKSQVYDALEEIIKTLPHEDIPHYTYEFKFNLPNEAFCVGQEVQAVAQGFDFKKAGYKYHGALEVIANILENTYLWDRVRLQGGAYGCDMMLTREGYLSITSYCDPQLTQTLKTYEEIADYLQSFTLDKALLERYIVTTLGTMIAPISMEQKSERASQYFITEDSPYLRPQIYEEILNVTAEDFKKYSQLFRAMNEQPMYCIIGNKEKILHHQNRFNVIHFSL